MSSCKQPRTRLLLNKSSHFPRSKHPIGFHSPTESDGIQCCAQNDTRGNARLQKRFWSTSEIRPEYRGVELNSSGVRWSTHTSSVAFSSLHRPLLLISIFNKLVLGANFRGRSKPTDRFRQIPTLGSYRIPKLRVRMSAYNRESDRIRCRILSHGINSSCFYHFYIHFFP